QREVSFEVQRGRLVRRVRLKDGRTYAHYCMPGVLKEVTHCVEERGDAGVTTGELWTALPNYPCTQISVALEFLKDRGCVEISQRRSYASSATLCEDVLTEFHYLVHVAARGA